MDKRRLCLIYGGRSGEHDVAVRSAISVDSALDRSKYDLDYIGITKAGRWVGGVRPLDFTARHRDAPTVSVHAVTNYDVVFPVLHGPYGEDGTIQGLFETLGVPYVGAGVLASALAMDKAMTKHLFVRHGLPTPRFRAFAFDEFLHHEVDLLDRIAAEFGFPCFVKPANLGSSLGITKVHDRPELKPAIEQAAEFDPKIVVEEAIDAREIEVSVLGNDDPSASLPGEIVPCHEFYDYNAKYIDDRSELLIPAPLSADQVETVQRLALAAYKAIDGAGMARVDFFLDKATDRFLLSELNTIPGFTSISMYPKLWEASGLPYAALLDRLIDLAIERHERRSRRAVAHQRTHDRRGTP